MPTRDERLVENEKRFRKANEALRGAVEPRIAPDEPVRFLCECSDTECFGDVELTLDEYGSVRAYSDRFILTPGHADPSVEQVVSEDESLMVVQKCR